MREPATRDRILSFLELLARDATEDIDLYLVGGATAVLTGWRDSTMDIDAPR